MLFVCLYVSVFCTVFFSMILIYRRYVYLSFENVCSLLKHHLNIPFLFNERTYNMHYIFHLIFETLHIIVLNWKWLIFFFFQFFFLYFPFGQVAWNNTTSVKVMVVITVTYRYLIHTILKSKTVRHYFLSFFIVDNVDVWNFYLFVRLW